MIHADDKVTRAIITIHLHYDAEISYIVGKYSWQRSPSETKFTWYSHATAPQWIRGEVAR
jgi:hypothetical protein